MGLPVTFMKIYFFILVCRCYNFKYLLIEINDDYSHPVRTEEKKYGKNYLSYLSGLLVEYLYDFALYLIILSITL